MKKLPVISSIRSALYYTYVNIGVLAKASAPWIGLYALYTLVFSLLGIEEYLDLYEAVAFVSEFPREAGAMGFDRLEILLPKLEAITIELGPLVQVHDIFDKLLRLVAYGSVAVAMHRSFILDEELPLISFESRELKYILYMVVYMSLIGGMAMILTSVVSSTGIGGASQGILLAIVALILLRLSVRFLLVFPAIALGDKAITPLKSWALTKGNAWGFYGGLLLVILSSLPISIFKVTIDKIALPLVIIWPAQLFLSMMVMTFILVFLSICYQYLVLPPKTENQGPLY